MCKITQKINNKKIGKEKEKEILKKCKKQVKGITLIALVVTIVLNCCEAAMDRINRKSKIIEII